MPRLLREQAAREDVATRDGRVTRNWLQQSCDTDCDTEYRPPVETTDPWGITDGALTDDGPTGS